MSLDRVRETLLAESRADADAELAGAEEWIERQRADAHRRASDRLAESDAAGRADADAQLATARAVARREARRLVLQARSEARSALVRRALEELQSLPDDPRSRVDDRLDALARSQLGPDAEVTVDPVHGGVVATASGRRVDYRLPVLVERCVDRMGPEVDRLWC
ncbi:MAG: hypothetical protein ACXV8G_09050 [Acidimicrobiales bacterium]